MGAVPWGKRRGASGDLEDAPEELAALTVMMRMREDGASLREIAASLGRDHGVKTRRGRPWAAETVRKILSAASRGTST
jgi:hypothetical protein